MVLDRLREAIDEIMRDKELYDFVSKHKRLIVREIVGGLLGIVAEFKAMKILENMGYKVIHKEHPLYDLIIVKDGEEIFVEVKKYNGGKFIPLIHKKLIRKYKRFMSKYPNKKLWLMRIDINTNRYEIIDLKEAFKPILE